MIRFKKGFTLAEVLITLSIIGVVAAVVMPTLVSSYQYKTVGTKLSKFVATTENAAQVYVANNGVFGINSEDNFVDFVNESFLIVRGETTTGTGQDAVTAWSSDAIVFAKAEVVEGEPKQPDNTIATNATAELKDGTRIRLKELTTNEQSGEVTTGFRGSITKSGKAAYGITFLPNVVGLPSFAQSEYNFVVTELGFVYPSDEDKCAQELSEAGWVTSSKTFGEDKACNLTTQQDATGESTPTP